MGSGIVKNYLRYGSIQIVLACILSSLLAGCTQFGAITESVFLMSPQEEQQLGGQLAAQLRPKQQFITDPEVNDYVLGVAHRVWRNAPHSDIPARFFVIKDSSINAYAIPGGNVYIQSGLVNAASDEAELAAVIAHECGHVIERHGARQASHATGASLLAQIVLGSSQAGQSALAQMASSIIAQGSLAHYSRQDESEADEIGVRTLNKAGYDPMAMRTFFQKISQKGGGSDGRLTQLFASHPPTPERMNHVSQLVALLPERDGERPTRELRRTQARLKALDIQ